MDDTVLLPVTASDDVTTPEIKYEYLDHTADVQIHSWGANVVEAFEQCAVGMFGYITDLKTVTPSLYTDVEVSGGDDLTETLYRFLDDLLFLFCAEPFMIPKKIKIINFDTANFRIKVRCYGEVFSLDKHPQGTEVKAITYSNMQINESANKVDIYVIVDI